MKTFKFTILTLLCAAGLLIRAAAQDAEPTNDQQNATEPDQPATAAQEEPEGAQPTISNEEILKQLQALQQQNQALQRLVLQLEAERSQEQNGPTQAERGPRPFPPERRGFRGDRGDRGGARSFAPETNPTDVFNATTNTMADDGTNGTIRLNFRGAPLEQVLTYLSEAAGFVIVLDTPARGTVDLWSEKPVSREDAVKALNAALLKNNLGVTREGNMLTVISTSQRSEDSIQTYQVGFTNPVPRSAEIVTAIIPVRYISASELLDNLSPLLPNADAMTANANGNSLILTDTLSTVHRIVDVVRALDRPMSSGTTFHVIQLNYADATELQQVLQTLYQNQGNNSRNPFQNFFRGFNRGGRGGFGGFRGRRGG